MNILEKLKNRKEQKAQYSYTVLFNTDEDLPKKAIEAISRYQKETSMNIKNSIIQMLASYYDVDSEVKISQKTPYIKESQDNKMTTNSESKDISKESNVAPKEEQLQSQKETSTQTNSETTPKGFLRDPDAQEKLKKLLADQKF